MIRSLSIYKCPKCGRDKEYHPAFLTRCWYCNVVMEERVKGMIAKVVDNVVVEVKKKFVNKEVFQY
jgi:uncharacterized protein with PIN domain